MRVIAPEQERVRDMVRLIKPLRFYSKHVRKALIAKRQRQNRKASKEKMRKEQTQDNR